MDFDRAKADCRYAFTASNSYTPRLRHAMFRLNWPDTELLFGQYWSMFCEWYAENGGRRPLAVTGTPTARLPQIRLTQKFLGDWTVAGMVGNPNRLPVETGSATYSTTADKKRPVGGNSAAPGENPYEHDWWGKAAYFGVPKPFRA